MKSRLFFLIVFMTMLGACATGPAPLRGQFSTITPTDATKMAANKELVRWGGRIIEVKPQSDRTCFEIVGAPLTSSGRPVDRDISIGRFIACRAGFYDPAIFTKDREMSIVGELTGHQDGKIGQASYRYPIVDAGVVYLWPKRDEVEVVPIIYRDPHWSWYYW